MRCPYCGFRFQIALIIEEKNDEINYGVIRCSCSEFPIIESILMLKEGLVKRYSLEYLRAGMNEKALDLALGPGGEDLCRIRGYLSRIGFWGKYPNSSYKFLTERFLRHISKNYRITLSFFQLHEQAYFKYRFASETLWLLYPFIRMLKAHKKRILELGCGRGHITFILSNYVDPEELICADETFKSLYILKKHFSKNAQCVCLNANYPLPFLDETFDSVIMSDSFHYILSRSYLAKEMLRVKSVNGLILLLHLHNSLIKNISAGYALTPEEWISLFTSSNLKIRAFPEGRLIEDFLYNDTLDLSREYSNTELNSANAIVIVATDDVTLFKTYNQVSLELLSLKQNLIINPIYEIEKREDNYALIRFFPNDLFKREYVFAEKYMPEIFLIPENAIKIFDFEKRSLVNEDENASFIEYSMKKFILINVPESYI